ncbi:MAG: DUF1398 domain-containing protein, partial [Comamonadaceae bacterium]
MHSDVVKQLAQATLGGHLPFPEIVGRLLAEGVECYRVDYVRREMVFYGADGSVVAAPMAFENLPLVASDFDAAALHAAIHDSQHQGQPFGRFSQRAVEAGVYGYYAFLRGKRVTYLGRQGDQHT